MFSYVIKALQLRNKTMQCKKMLTEMNSTNKHCSKDWCIIFDMHKSFCLWLIKPLLLQSS